MVRCGPVRRPGPAPLAVWMCIFRPLPAFFVSSHLCDSAVGQRASLLYVAKPGNSWMTVSFPAPETPARASFSPRRPRSR